MSATWSRLGDLALRMKDEQAAEEAYRAALELEPRSSAVLFGLGRLAMARGEPQEAVSSFQSALETQPEGSVIHHPPGHGTPRCRRCRARPCRAGAQPPGRGGHQRSVDAELARLDVSRESASIVPSRRLGSAVATRRSACSGSCSSSFLTTPKLTTTWRVPWLPRAPSTKPSIICSRRWPFVRFRDAHFNLAVLLGRQGEPEAAVEHLIACRHRRCLSTGAAAARSSARRAW